MFLFGSLGVSGTSCFDSGMVRVWRGWRFFGIHQPAVWWINHNLIIMIKMSGSKFLYLSVATFIFHFSTSFIIINQLWYNIIAITLTSTITSLLYIAIMAGGRKKMGFLKSINHKPPQCHLLPPATPTGSTLARNIRGRGIGPGMVRIFPRFGPSGEGGSVPPNLG